jgi:DNA-binding SARP family transcriptional activator
MTKEFDILSTRNVMFCLYGTVGASVDGVRVGLGTEMERRLAVPLLRARGRSVSYLELADWMWDGRPQDVSEYVADFRTRLGELGLRNALTSRDRVCRLRIEPNQVDAHRLTARVAEADQLDDHTAAARLREALVLCAGEPLAGLTGPRMDDYRHVLREERRRAELALIRVDFRLGHVVHHIPKLVRLFGERPEDTEVVTLTMYAFASAGRRVEALAVYRRSCERLIELGMKVPQRMAELVPQLESHT